MVAALPSVIALLMSLSLLPRSILVQLTGGRVFLDKPWLKRGIFLANQHYLPVSMSVLLGPKADRRGGERQESNYETTAGKEQP